MSRPVFKHALRAALALALLAILGVTLGACGKEGRPSAPAGEESRYTYPQVYPKPASVVPLGEEEVLKTGEVPAHAGGISTFPSTTSVTVPTALMSASPVTSATPIDPPGTSLPTAWAASTDETPPPCIGIIPRGFRTLLK